MKRHTREVLEELIKDSGMEYVLAQLMLISAKAGATEKLAGRQFRYLERLADDLSGVWENYRTRHKRDDDV